MGKLEMFRKQTKGGWRFLALGLFALFMVSAIAEDTAQAKSVAPSVIKNMTLSKGKTGNITVKVTKGVTIKKVSWKSSNKKVVTVKANGKGKAKVTAVKKGTATVTATVSYKYKKKDLKKKYTIKITVKDNVSSHGKVIASGNCGKKNASDVKWTFYEDGTLYIYGKGDMKDYTLKSVPGHLLTDTPWEMSEVKEVEIASGVTSVGKYAFCVFGGKGSCNVKKVSLPKGITKIGEGAFCGCSRLTNINIPEGVTSIGKFAFYECKRLTSITIPEGVTSIEGGTFTDCTSLTSITIPNTVTSIESDSLPGWSEHGAFYGCTSLTSITIPEGVTSIGESAFVDCNSLTSITIPEGVTSIGESAFRGCKSLTSITIPEGVTSIGVMAFSGCYFAKENVHNNSSETLWDATIVDSDDNGMCLVDGKLVHARRALVKGDVTIPEGVTSIREYAFYGCESLTSITIPEGVTSIEDGTFENCTSLTSITIPEGVISIGEDAFRSCASLTSITIPKTVTSIWDDAFLGCYFLKENVHNNSSEELCGATIVDSDDNGMCLVDGRLVRARPALVKGDVTIPEGVTSIREDAFKDCTSLKSITWKGVTYNSWNEFYSACESYIE